MLGAQRTSASPNSRSGLFEYFAFWEHAPRRLVSRLTRGRRHVGHAGDEAHVLFTGSLGNCQNDLSPRLIHQLRPCPAEHVGLPGGGGKIRRQPLRPLSRAAAATGNRVGDA